MDASKPPKPAKAAQKASEGPAQAPPNVFGFSGPPAGTDAQPASQYVEDPWTPRAVTDYRRKYIKELKENLRSINPTKFPDFRSPESHSEGK